MEVYEEEKDIDAVDIIKRKASIRAQANFGDNVS